jgi:hypothetical protein
MGARSGWFIFNIAVYYAIAQLPREYVLYFAALYIAFVT